MTKPARLTKYITEKEFDNGYWYAHEIKTFAKTLGIANSSKLRKDELEQLIKHFLRTGQIRSSDRKNVVNTGIRDIDIGLTLSLPINHYTSNWQTKNFVIAEAQKIDPDLVMKSGVWYRLNRWRDEQVTKGKKITYRDLINHFIKLNHQKFKKVVVVRYINFLSDFLANEKDATKERAIKAWGQLKKLDIPKDYKSWKSHVK